MFDASEATPPVSLRVLLDGAPHRRKHGSSVKTGLLEPTEISWIRLIIFALMFFYSHEAHSPHTENSHLI